MCQAMFARIPTGISGSYYHSTTTTATTVSTTTVTRLARHVIYSVHACWVVVEKE